MTTGDQAIDLQDIEDPIKFLQLGWPDFRLYDEQYRIVQSVRENVETYVPAGNMLGKDFISGFIALWFFCSRTPARVVTTSVDHSQLKGVLWGEIRRLIDASRIPLGIQVNDLLCRQVRTDGTIDPRSELIGRVAQKGEGMLGRHLERGPDNAPRTLAIIDEASGFDDVHYNSIVTWAHRVLVIGNPYPCENFFKRSVRNGDIQDDTGGKGYFRKVIKIPASASPNVRLAEAEIAAGKKPSGTVVIPGVMSWSEYQYRRRVWDKYKQTIGLDAEFYEGTEVKLFPPSILADSVQAAAKTGRRSTGATMGVDTGEGGDSTVWTIADELGIVDQISFKTSDTSVIPGRTIALIHDYKIDPSRVLFDSGGGGKEHVDLLRSRGYPVQAIAFGGSPTPSDQYAFYKRSPEQREVEREERDIYKNRRAEMYGEASKVVRGAHASGIGRDGFGIPADLVELRRQLEAMPKQYDEHGRLYLPPKNKPTAGFNGVTISQLLGCSPDEADSFVLAVFALVWTDQEVIAGSIF